MTEAITRTLQLIQTTLEQITVVNSSVENIASGTIQLGSNVQAIDSAMQEVEVSNRHMVENMNEVSEVMKQMTISIADADTQTRTMRSKYIETSSNVMNINMIVGQLIEELGDGGFMTTEDVKPGMYLTLEEAHGTATTEYSECVEAVENNCITVKNLRKPFTPSKLAVYNATIIVDNGIYRWSNVKVAECKNGNYVLTVSGNPKVFNRRKYHRLRLDNSCTFFLNDSDQPLIGTMVNISAGGFSFSSTAPALATAKSAKVRLCIDNLDVAKEQNLTATIIRVTDNDGIFIIGCRMLEDNPAIYRYVEEHYKLS